MAVELKPQADDKPVVHEIAGGWITEKADTGVPAFLRACYVLISSAAAAYLIIYMYGETSHSDRGPLVKQFNLVTITNEPFMYIVAALVVAYIVILSIFAAGKAHK